MTGAPTVYATISSYVLGKLVGAKPAEAFITEAVAKGTLPDDAPVPATPSLHVLAEMYDVALRVDGGATCIARARSRHLAAALESKRDVWVTMDDDVAATPSTLHWLVEAVEGPEPRICFAPYLLRNAAGVACVEWTSVYMDRKLSGGGLARRARRGGFGLVAMNRAAMQAAALGAPQYIDDDGTRRPAPFLELITDQGSWLGEDLAFFHRLAPGVLVEALVTGETWHAGAPLDLTECNGPIFPVQSLDRLTNHPEINATTRLPSNPKG